MTYIAAALAALLAAAPAFAGETPAPEGARAYIVSPVDGATVTSPVAIVFGLSGMGVAPAGVDAENTGHHHLLIDVPLDEIDLDNPLPADDNYIHFGAGQTETTRDFAPGQHTLRILLGDLNHIPHNPPVMSDLVTITVE